MPRSFPARLLLPALALAACSDGFGPEAPLPCEADQMVTIGVEPGLRPVFTWEPGCGVSSLQVFGPDEGGVWVLYSGERAAENPIGSGVRYGEVPDGMVEAGPATPLERGEAYTVRVYRWIGEPGGPGSLFQRGSAAFEVP